MFISYIWGILRKTYKYNLFLFSKRFDCYKWIFWPALKWYDFPDLKELEVWPWVVLGTGTTWGELVFNNISRDVGRYFKRIFFPGFTLITKQFLHCFLGTNSFIELTIVFGQKWDGHFKSLKFKPYTKTLLNPWFF